MSVPMTAERRPPQSEDIGVADAEPEGKDHVSNEGTK